MTFPLKNLIIKEKVHYIPKLLCTAQNINPTLMVLKAMKKSCEPKAEG